MTKIFVTKQNNSIVEIECEGHTGYGVQTAILGLFSVAGVNLDYKTDDKRGYLKATLPKNLDKATRHDCDVILNTMMLGIADLHEGFSDFIELEVR